MNQVAARLHAAFHSEESAIYRVIQGVVWGLILASILLLVVEPLLVDLLDPRVLHAIDTGFLSLFAVEYVLRIATYRPPSLEVFRPGRLHTLRNHVVGRLRYAAHPMMVIDLLAVIALFPELRSLRALRLLRLVRTAKLFGYNNPVRAVLSALEQNRVLYAFALSVLAVETVVGGASLYLVERHANPGVDSLFDGLWWALVTLTTVGFGDITPVTGLGRIIGATLMIAGMFTLSLFAGVVGSSLIGVIVAFREEQFRMGEDINHIVVCGFDDSTEMLLDLLAEGNAEQCPIVVFDDRERPPNCRPDFLWVQGDPTKQSELDKVRLTHARAVIVVGSRDKSPQAADATTILVVFTIRSYLTKNARTIRERRAPLYIVAEILDSENIEHARTAGADEVVETRRLGFSMIAHTVQHHHTAHTLSRVVLAGSTNVYIGEIPGGLREPETFGALLVRLRLSEHGALVIGLRPPRGGDEVFNPPKSYVVEPGTTLIYMAPKAVLDPAR